VGFNLILVRWPDNDPAGPVEDEHFDALRYIGDKTFCYWLADNGHAREEAGFDPVYRPRSFAVARDWVHCNIWRSDQRARLLTLLDLLRWEPSLWLWGSF
jgi:hypothetical protein